MLISGGYAAKGAGDALIQDQKIMIGFDSQHFSEIQWRDSKCEKIHAQFTNEQSM